MKIKHKLGYHKGSGQAYVLHKRKRLYLGKWPGGPDAPVPPEIEQRFREAVAKIALAHGGKGASYSADADAGCDLLLSELIAGWLEWARERYSGSTTVASLEWGTKALLNLFGQELASSIGPKRIAETQRFMVANGLSRQGINKATTFIRQLFSWGVAQELLRPEQLVGIKAIQPIRRGAIAAPEAPLKKLVPLDVVEATLPFLSPTVAAMVRLQVLTGMRPVEVCNLSVGEIDRVAKNRWVYRPLAHKMAHLGRVRQIPLLPDAITLLMPFMRADGKPVFSPADAREAWELEKRARRKSKVQPSQLDRSKVDPLVVPGEQYTTASYRRAIKRGCQRARRAAEEAGQGVDCPDWSPNGLRKLAAQTVADELGIDAARSLLGHADEETTRNHYAKMELEKAVIAAGFLADSVRLIKS